MTRQRAKRLRSYRLYVYSGRLGPPRPELQPLLVSDPNSYDNLNVQNVVSGGASASRSSAALATPTSTQRSGPSTFRPPIRASSATMAVLNVGAFTAADDYNYYPAATLWPTWDRQTCKPRPSRSSAPLPTRPCTPITPTPRGFIPSRPVRNTGRLSFASTTASASSTPRTTSALLASTPTATRCGLLGSIAVSHRSRRGESRLSPRSRSLRLTRGGSYYGYFGQHRRQGTGNVP